MKVVNNNIGKNSCMSFDQQDSMKNMDNLSCNFENGEEIKNSFEANNDWTDKKFLTERPELDHSDPL